MPVVGTGTDIGTLGEQDPTGDESVAALRATHVTVHFGGLTALSDVSLDVPRGAVVGLVGPNGAGKTTIIHMMLGLISPNAGSVRLFGKNHQELLG